MIILRVFHEKTFAAILSEDDKDFIWSSPYDLNDLYSVDGLNIPNKIAEFPDWIEAQKYLVGVRVVASSKLISRLENKPVTAGCRGLTPSESRRILIDHVLTTLLPKRGFEDALQFVNAASAFYDFEDDERDEMQKAMEDQPEECRLRLGYILNKKEFECEWKISQALLHINEVLIPEGRGEEAKGVIYHILSKGHAKNPALVNEAERLYKAAKRVNAIARKEQMDAQPDYKRNVSMTPKIKVF